MDHLIAEHRRSAVARALTAAFGVEAPDSIAALSGGFSGASIFRIEVGGRPYVLRLEKPEDNMVPAAIWFGCMRAAAAAGVAPAVHYADVQDRVTILNFIAERSLFADYAGTRSQLIDQLAGCARRLHETPIFPPLVDYMEGVGALVARLQSTGLLGETAFEPVSATYAILQRAYPRREQDQVSSHNDLNPRNILYDGRDIWMVDWESAFAADRYVDLSSFANAFAGSEAECQQLLAAYWRREPTASERSRFYLMRQVNHLFYGVILLTSVAMERPHLRLAEIGGPSLDEVKQALLGGRIDMDHPEGRLAYAKARLNAAIAGVKADAFHEACGAIAE